MSVRLMTPGPTAILDEAQKAMAQPILHHRTEPFRAIVRECRDGLKKLYRTRRRRPDPRRFGHRAGWRRPSSTSSRPGTSALVGSCGKFGDRWANIAKAYGIEAELYRTETGRALDRGRACAQAREDPPEGAVRHRERDVGRREERPRGARDDRQVASPETLVVADAITAVGAFRFETGAWGLDAVVCGSQKALSLPPGLAFISLSARAREAVKTARLPRFYFDLGRELGKQTSGDTGFTPAISLIVGLRASLGHLLGPGSKPSGAKTARRAACARAGLGALGVALVPKDGISESVTAAWVPEGIDGAKFLKDLEALTGIKIAGGQDELKGKIFRISHFGPVTAEATIEVLAGIEELLARAGRPLERGAAAAAARSALEAGA